MVIGRYLFLALFLTSYAWAGTLCLSDTLCLTDSTPDIHDGDTVAFDGQRVRLWGIDAPELAQTHGQASKDCLHTVLHGNVFALEHKGQSFDRQVARVSRVTVHAHGGAMQFTDVAEELLLQGCAWHDPRYAHGAFGYREAAWDARERKAGLWALEQPMAPWEWRKLTKERE